MNDKPEPPPRKRLISVSHYTRLINAMNVETSPPPVNTWYIPKLISNTPVIWAEGSVPKVSLKSAPPSKSIPTFGDTSSQETIQHRRPRLHKCTYPGCYKLFAFSKHWKLHMEGHARVVRDNWRPLNPYPWSKCASKAPLSSAKLMDDHLNNIHINPLICTIDDCNFKTPFTRKTDLHRHIEEFHGQVYNYKFEERDFLKRTYSKIASFKRKAVRILFNGKETFARPDTASDQNIITEAFANEHGIPIHTSTSHQSVLGLGNGTYVTTLGRAKVPIKVLGGDRTISKEEYQWFDVLRRCPVPLILDLNSSKKPSYGPNTNICLWIHHTCLRRSQLSNGLVHLGASSTSPPTDNSLRDVQTLDQISTLCLPNALSDLVSKSTQIREHTRALCSPMKVLSTP